jgi:hypothetical protein
LIVVSRRRRCVDAVADRVAAIIDRDYKRGAAWSGA